jgi:iron-sulfur cluster repair protein YtfE (RIC family)
MTFVDDTAPTAEGEAMAARFGLIHDLIRRDLATVRELANRVLAGAGANTVQSEIASLAVSSPVWSLQAHCLRHCGFVRGHHLHEDHAWFPLLRRVNPALTPALRRLRHEHELVAGLLERIEFHTRGLVGEPTAAAELSASLNELAEYLLAHLEWEEEAIFPTIRRMSDWDL